MSAITNTSSTITYEEIMGLQNNVPQSGLNNSGNTNAADVSSAAAIKALSKRLVTFRKWLTDEAKITIHPALCIVNGEATDGTRNAPVLVVQKASAQRSSSTGGSTINNASGVGIIPTDTPSAIIDNTAITGRLGTVDGEGDISLYDRTMGCCVRAVRELKSNEVIMTMPRSAMITPDLVAASDAGRAVLACCKIDKSVIDRFSNNSNANSSLDANNQSSDTKLGFWDAFENTTECESKFSAKIMRTSGPQMLVKILQERKKAEAAYKKSLNKSAATNDNFPDNSINDEKQYKLAEYGTISTRAPFLAFLIHQRFSNALRPKVVSYDNTTSLYDDDVDDNDDEDDNEFQIARDSDDGNALSVIDTHGGQMTILPTTAAETFAPYARTLPSSVSLPLCWKRNELALLANCISGTPLLQEVATTTSQLVAEFTALLDAGISARFPKTFPEGLLTWDRWVWAAAVFTSRILPASCYINAGDGKASSFRPTNPMDFQSPPHIWDELGVMIPLLDMLNHEIEEHQVTWQPCISSVTSKGTGNGIHDNTTKQEPTEDENNENVSTYLARAIVHKKVKKGSELYTCYGHLSTSNLILQYGFAQLNGGFDEVRLGWALADAIGNVDPPPDFIPNFPLEKELVFESNNEQAINSWWTSERITLLEQEAFSIAETSFMPNLLLGKKMTATAHGDGTFHPILLASTVVATLPVSHLQNFTDKHAESQKDRKIIITKRHQRIIQRYLQFWFRRKLEKLLQNLDSGLKDHFGNINLWTKATDGGLRYSNQQSNGAKYVGWQSFFDSHAYKATMEVEKRYYAMGSDSCVLALYDGQLRALQSSLDHVTNDEKFAKGVLQQLRDLGFEISNEELEFSDADEKADEQVLELKNVKSEDHMSDDDEVPQNDSHTTDVERKTSTNEESQNNGKNSNGNKSPRNRKRNKKKPIIANTNTSDKPPAVKLHIGNLSYSTTPSNLYDYFSSIYGQDNVLECHIPIERETGKSRGFGFVALPEAVAMQALQSRQKHEVDGRVLKIARSNSAGAVATPKPVEGPPVAATGRCMTCGYRPKYCTCPAPNVPPFDRYSGDPRGPPPPFMVPPPPPPPPPPHMPVRPYGQPIDYPREPPRDYRYYEMPPDRYGNGHRRDVYEGDNRFRDYDRDRRYDYRYDDDYYRGYDRDFGYYRDGGQRERGRDHSRDRSPGSRSSSTRRRDHDDGRGSRNRDDSRSRRSARKDDDDWEQSKKRNIDRKDRTKKKKSKRRTRSRSASPPGIAER